MKSIVKLKRGGIVVPLTFEHAEKILQKDSVNFEIAEPKKVKFENGKLIKLSTKKDSDK